MKRLPVLLKIHIARHLLSEGDIAQCEQMLVDIENTQPADGFLKKPKTKEDYTLIGMYRLCKAHLCYLKVSNVLIKCELTCALGRFYFGNTGSMGCI